MNLGLGIADFTWPDRRELLRRVHLARVELLTLVTAGRARAAPAAPMEVSAELLGQPDDDALRAT